ncbi:MAG: hypothetical protein F6K18_10760 [Okeania sp. SIO2C2]|uniref:hypothetical protein n=1 Tax=Okeania sp. SIO2C2 TaxID=2607787 RepID=UPI0013BC2FC6|nr:hypothetical protein [Okeania sp. SIO2C2]NEP87269.1 hypothetical protein [Okeania sp. SIO2C2]
MILIAHYLGVNPPLAPPPPSRGTGVRSQERRKRNRRRKFFGRVKVMDFYRALIRT